MIEAALTCWYGEELTVPPSFSPSSAKVLALKNTNLALIKFGNAKNQLRSLSRVVSTQRFIFSCIIEFQIARYFAPSFSKKLKSWKRQVRQNSFTYGALKNYYKKPQKQF